MLKYRTLGWSVACKVGLPVIQEQRKILKMKLGQINLGPDVAGFTTDVTAENIEITGVPEPVTFVLPVTGASYIYEKKT